MSQQKYTPYREIVKELDIPKGDMLLLTSDILKLAIKSKKAEKEFDINAFLNTFVEALGPDGTLLIPSYNFDLENGDAYSILQTGPMTGSLAVCAMERDDFIRTAHPLHSFLVWGKDATALAGMSNISSFGPDSPFAYLMEKNALMVFAGTSVADAMTFTHFVEESEQVRYRKYKRIRIRYSDLQNKTAEHIYNIYSKKPGWTMKLHRIEEILHQDALKLVNVNGVSFFLIRCIDAFEAVSKDIRENNAASIAGFSISLYIRDIIKQGLQRFNIFRTTYGKIRSGKRLH